MISLNIILSEIEEYAPVLHLPKGKCVSFQSIRFFSEHISDFQKEHIYIGFLEDIVKTGGNTCAEVYFVCFGSPQQFAQLKFALKCNVVLLPDQAHFSDVLNHLYGRYYRLSEWSKEVDIAISKHCSIQEIINISEPLFENPLVVWTPSFEVVAYTRNIPIAEGFTTIHQILNDGRFPTKMLEYFVEKKFLSGATSFRTPQLLHPPNEIKCPQYLCTISHKKLILRSMSMFFVNTEPQDDACDMFLMLLEKLQPYVVELFSDEATFSAASERMLISVLDEEITGVAAQEKLVLLKLPLQGYFRVIVVEFSNYTHMQSEYIMQIFRNHLPFAKILLYCSHVVVLDRMTQEVASYDTLESTFPPLPEHLKSLNGWCGISSVFEKLTDLLYAYKKALIAISCGREAGGEDRCFHFRDFFWNDLLQSYSDKIPLEQLYYRTLDKVMDYDAQTGINNLELLGNYLSNDRSISQTAKQLHLHRNSVIYRIKRIEEMLEGDLSNYEFRWRIILSLKILKLLGKL